MSAGMSDAEFYSFIRGAVKVKEALCQGPAETDARDRVICQEMLAEIDRRSAAQGEASWRTIDDCPDEGWVWVWTSRAWEEFSTPKCVEANGSLWRATKGLTQCCHPTHWLPANPPAPPEVV